jgi:hypothetical protein
MNKPLTLTVLLLVALTGCRPKQDMATEPKSDAVTATSANRDYIESHGLDGKRVLITGTYRLMNVNKRPGGEPVYIGRAYIELADGSTVILETNDAGIRPIEEQALLTDEVVVAEGILYAGCTAWGDGTEASIIGACLRDISRVAKK